LKRLFFVFAVLLFFLSTSRAQDSCHLRISLLTCAPGEELYSSFGHTAIRVRDSTTDADLIYNYGTFDFGPDFYSQFIRGKLLYALSVENFQDFLSEYQAESRSVVEQELRLTCGEKQRLYRALQVNSLEENRHYRYDFLFDNCTTRARDIVAANTDHPVVFHNILPSSLPSFRDLIHLYLDRGHAYWSKLGIDILLGARLDRKVKNEQAMFLPDWLLKGFDSSRVQQNPLVNPPQPVLTMPSPGDDSPLLTPSFCSWAGLLLILGLSFARGRWSGAFLTVFDFLLFFLLGMAGCLLLFMWLGTDHRVCRDNFNLLWALPTHLLTAFTVHRRTRISTGYFRFVLWLSLALAMAWFFLPQQMNNALLPLVLLIIYRSWYLSKKTLYGTKTNHP